MEIELITEGYKSVQEWGKWLVTIETAICAALWPKLAETPRPPASIYLGWAMFLGSIVTTAVMLGRPGGPLFRPSEVARLGYLAGIVATLLH